MSTDSLFFGEVMRSYHQFWWYSHGPFLHILKERITSISANAKMVGNIGSVGNQMQQNTTKRELCFGDLTAVS